MRTILSPAERIRNARVKEIMEAKRTPTQREKASQNQNKVGNPLHLTQSQMDEVKELIKSQGIERQDAVKLVLSRNNK
jgi:hypothetical protein